jgi:hypothetical protein
MDIKKRPAMGAKRADRTEHEIEALVAKGRLRAKHGPKRTGHSHVLAAALAHADPVEYGHGTVSSLSHRLGRTIRRGPASG